MKTIRETIDALEACEKERIALEKTVERLRAELAIHRCKAAGEYWVWQGDGDNLESLVCPIVIHPDDMRKRDAAERERVKAVIRQRTSEGGYQTEVDAIYPPPKPEKAATILVKLPAGAYWVKGMDGLNPRLPIFISELNVEPNKLGDYVMVPPNPFHSLPPKPETLPAGYWWEREGGEGSWSCSEYYEDFIPCDNYEYRHWNDPPPEVTGKVETQPVPDASRVGEFKVYTTAGPMRINACSQDHAERIVKYDGHTLLPTFEEWCEANVEEWKVESCYWYDVSAMSKYRTLPSDVFTELQGCAITGEYCKVFVSSKSANAALKDALLKLGRIRP